MAGTGLVSMEWRPFLAVETRQLTDSRLQLHHAAQIIVSAAISYLPGRDDDSHTNMEWLPAHRALATNVIEPAHALRFALRPADLTLLSLERDAVRATFALEGQRLPAALAWMSDQLAAAGLDPARLTTRKHYEIPGHPVGSGAAWRLGDDLGFRALDHAYHNAWLACSAVARRTPGASEVRCWPHHFDIATLITLPPGDDGVARTVGAGLSPGDDSYAEPYFYVTPYPYPPAEALVPLPDGAWHTTGWTGAVLTSSSLTASAEETQRHRVTVFLDSAVEACRRALTAA